MKELTAIQTDIRVGKDNRNDFGNYNYRSAEDIMARAKPVLARHKCRLFISDTIQLIGDRFYITATATLTNEAGESVVTQAHAREADVKRGMDVSQITGATSSYARKYALQGLFLLDDGQDADSQNISPEYTEKPQITVDEINTILTAVNLDELKKVCNGLREIYGSKTIKPFYERRKGELENA